MNEKGAARKAAEHKAAALHHLGYDEGAGATIWARAVRDNLELHESAQANWADAASRDMATWERLHVTALILVVAIDQVLAFERRVWALTEDAELAEARADFDRIAPHAEALRDIVAHLDSYAVGEGFRQRGKRVPSVTRKYVAPLIWWTDDGATTLNLGDESLDLRSAAAQALVLAEVVEKVRAKHMKVAGVEADAAFRRQFGIEA
jgi:hypothetical protein